MNRGEIVLYICVTTAKPVSPGVQYILPAVVSDRTSTLDHYTSLCHPIIVQISECCYEVEKTTKWTRLSSYHFSQEYENCLLVFLPQILAFSLPCIPIALSCSRILAFFFAAFCGTKSPQHFICVIAWLSRKIIPCATSMNYIHMARTVIQSKCSNAQHLCNFQLFISVDYESNQNVQLKQVMIVFTGITFQQIYYQPIGKEHMK